MNRIVCFIKAIIRCLTPKEKIKYYKHQKTLVGVEPELINFPSETGEELIVPTEQYKRMMNELEKCIKR